jgi:broad specificity phosphatase PhoE
MAVGYLEGEKLEGWEPASEVRKRFTAAVSDVAAAADGDVCVVDHGLALTLYLAARSPQVVRDGDRSQFDPVPFWSSLTFPDAWLFNPAANTVTRIYDGGLHP